MSGEHRLAALASCAAVPTMLGLGAAQAASIAIRFATPAGALGTSQVYRPVTAPVTAYGFTTPPTSDANKYDLTPTDLYGKKSSSDETGLGLAPLSRTYPILLLKEDADVRNLGGATVLPQVGQWRRSGSDPHTSRAAARRSPISLKTFLAVSSYRNLGKSDALSFHCMFGET